MSIPALSLEAGRRDCMFVWKLERHAARCGGFCRHHHGTCDPWWPLQAQWVALRAELFLCPAQAPPPSCSLLVSSFMALRCWPVPGFGAGLVALGRWCRSSTWPPPDLTADKGVLLGTRRCQCGRKVSFFSELHNNATAYLSFTRPHV